MLKTLQVLMATLVLTGLALANPLLSAVFWITATPTDVQRAVQQGAKVEARDQTGRTPLHWAAFFNFNPEVITTLVGLGAQVEARDQNGMTPLHQAAAVGKSNPEVIATVVKLGAQVDARDKDGWTPLHRAARFNPNPKIVLTLLELGANPKARTDRGRTPWNLIQENDELKNTDAYWRLNDLRY